MSEGECGPPLQRTEMQGPHVLSIIKDFIFREGRCCPQPLPFSLWEIAPRPPHSSAALWRAWGTPATPAPPWALVPLTTGWRGEREEVRPQIHSCRTGYRCLHQASGEQKCLCRPYSHAPPHGCPVDSLLELHGSRISPEMLTLQSKSIEQVLIPQSFHSKG